MSIKIHQHELERRLREQGKGMFGSPEDCVLLDEIITMACEERRRPSKRQLAL